MGDREFVEMVEIATMAYVASTIVDDDDVNKPGRRARTVWQKKWLSRREEEGFSTKLLKELREEEPELFRNALRMSAEQFDYLLDLVKPHIEKADTPFRKSIPAVTRLALTLRYLATGETFNSLRLLFRIAQPTMSALIPEVLDAIYKVLVDKFFKQPFPKNANEWEILAKPWNEKWNFPNCIGAVDGKHVVMIAPPNAGSLYYNYKGTHSIVLMGVADADYKLLYIDVGRNGRFSDGGVFSRCTFSQALDRNELHLPPPKALPMRDTPVPYVLVADDAFAMQANIMKPFAQRSLTMAQRTFNYRLSRARRVIENVFGIMAMRFRVLHSPIHLDADKSKKVVMACAVLHNFLMTKNRAAYAPHTAIDQYDDVDKLLRAADWRDGAPTTSMLPLQPQHDPLNDAKQIQDEFMHYFIGEGELPWQYDRL